MTYTTGDAQVSIEALEPGDISHAGAFIATGGEVAFSVTVEGTTLAFTVDPKQAAELSGSLFAASVKARGIIRKLNKQSRNSESQGK